MDLIKNDKIPAGLTDTALQKNVETWFWRSLIWDAFAVYAYHIWGEDPLQKAFLDRADLKTITLLGLVYVMTGKVLTGSLGALSEPSQLKLQQYAWVQQSTKSMTPDGPEKETELAALLSPFNWGWLDYHSAMKDLTGLWFKASLFEAIDHEKPGDVWMGQVSQVLGQDNGQIWREALKRKIELMKDPKWLMLQRNVRADYFEGLISLNWQQLMMEIARVETELSNCLKLPPNQQPRTLKKPRPFLHYVTAPPWEGRYDTMWEAIARPDGTYAYLVEHRFN